MEREQIIKALDSFHKRILETDLAEKIYETEIVAIIYALSLIKELTEEKNEVFEKGAENLNKVEEDYLKLEAENLKLTEENKRLRAIPEQLHKEMSERMIEERRIERKLAVKKMQKRLNNCINDKLAYHGWCIKETIIPKVTKEMLEESE